MAKDPQNLYSHKESLEIFENLLEVSEETGKKIQFKVNGKTFLKIEKNDYLFVLSGEDEVFYTNEKLRYIMKEFMKKVKSELIDDMGLENFKNTFSPKFNRVTKAIKAEISRNHMTKEQKEKSEINFLEIEIINEVAEKIPNATLTQIEDNLIFWEIVKGGSKIFIAYKRNEEEYIMKFINEHGDFFCSKPHSEILDAKQELFERIARRK